MSLNRTLRLCLTGFHVLALCGDTKADFHGSGGGVWHGQAGSENSCNQGLGSRGLGFSMEPRRELWKEFESASSHQTVPGEQPQQHCICRLYKHEIGASWF